MIVKVFVLVAVTRQGQIQMLVTQHLAVKHPYGINRSIDQSINQSTFKVLIYISIKIILIQANYLQNQYIRGGRIIFYNRLVSGNFVWCMTCHHKDKNKRTNIPKNRSARRYPLFISTLCLRIWRRKGSELFRLEQEANIVSKA